MTFEQYCAVIEMTAHAHGWSMFLPSVYELTQQPQMRVYENLPEPGTDQQVARHWARSFTDVGTNIFLAYRDGDGMILVEEILNGQTTRSHLLNLARTTYGASV